MPGVAQAISLKTPGNGNDATTLKTIPALLLPEIMALKISGSLIVPRDTFQANLQCEMSLPNKEKSNIKMGFSVLNGVDFERISFTQE